MQVTKDNVCIMYMCSMLSNKNICALSLTLYEYNIILFLVYGECEVNRCKNEGRCFKMAASYVCDCVNGYTGVLCQHSKYWYT